MSDRGDDEAVAGDQTDQKPEAPADATNDIAPDKSEGTLPTARPPADSRPIDGVEEIEVSLEQRRLRIMGLSTKSSIYAAGMVATTIELALPNPDWLKATGIVVTVLLSVLAARRRRE